ncbi:MAG: hypothetical protein RR595_09680 [Lysinibacillus sp.]
MRVCSLSGPSGTGKSTSALVFAYKNNLDAIIDDGLLIVNGIKVAGRSAKFEKNIITAVRRAIFNEQEHCEEVKKALVTHQVSSLLIIGTSDKMTKTIAKRLEIEPINSFYYVEEIRTQKEIQKARFIRETQGKHVMPIPYRQVEQNFFKRLILRGKEIFSHKREKIGETTIVRPDFQQQYIEIDKVVYIQLIEHCCRTYPIVKKVEHVHFVIGEQIQTDIVVQLKAPITYDLQKRIHHMQQTLQQLFYAHFGYEIDTINVTVKSLEKRKIV